MNDRRSVKDPIVSFTKVPRAENGEKMNYNPDKSDKWVCPVNSDSTLPPTSVANKKWQIKTVAFRLNSKVIRVRQNRCSLCQLGC